MGRDPVRDAQGPRERGAVRVLDEQQVPERQWGERAEAVPVGPGPARAGRQLERETERRAAARDVIVEVPVQALEARIQVRREPHGRRQLLDIDRRP